ncbi:hypothetical protein BJ138DRAFT_564147 [Hygrophoropsis aurantiaca]|uniref:Uncharacterized protein n=1 Tax=Hygrophoropsis aurantiaca TaxID=72124 RepID=A0ACB8A183_9AGAM|nr:hypothetical protein BJ138DRAFT_564147 [Hygrophoropsis aurantiaca]
MTTVYKQFFWTIAADVTAQPEDIGCEKRTHLHQAAWDLHSIPSVLLACAGGGTAQDHPEISLTFPAETHNTAEQFTDHIQKALANHGYHAKPSLQEETRFYTLDESDVARVKAAASCTEDEKEMWRLIESAHSVTFDSPESIKLLDADSSSPFTAPPLQAQPSPRMPPPPPAQPLALPRAPPPPPAQPLLPPPLPAAHSRSTPRHTRP